METNNQNSSPGEYSPFIKGCIRLVCFIKTRTQRNEETKRLKALRIALETITEEYEKASINKDEEKMKIFNISLFVFTVELDVSSLIFMIPFHEMDKWNQQLLGRQLAVILYESTDDLLELLGKDFRLLINKLTKQDELSKKIKKYTKELNIFKNQNKDALQEIRNYCGAHRDKNAYKQLEVINNIETNDLLKLTADFMKPVSKLTPLFSEVMNEMISNN